MPDTAAGTPYVDPGDAVADYPTTSRALADRVDAVALLATTPAHGVFYRNPDAVPSGPAEVVSWSGARSRKGITATGTELVVTAAGVYLVTAFVQWAANAAGRRTIAVKANGNPRALDTRAVADASPIGQTVTTAMVCAAGERITVETAQNSGATLATPEGVTCTVLKVAEVTP